MRKQIAAANWKMNKTLSEGKELLNEIISAEFQLTESRHVLFAIPFPYLTETAELIKSKKNMHITAQNCSNKTSGAYTGEVSVSMLKSIDIHYCLVGHSERREYFSESNATLAEKVNLCLAESISPVFCCGEPLSVRDAATQNEFVELQLKESLFHLSADQLKNVIIAYEPIWAIGTGRTASAEQAQEMHAHIRSVIANQYGADVAENTSILYGGSVKGSNASEIFSMPDVDGGLVGGASLIAAEFIQIIKALK
jgi:triosephosphate isomerase